jgi:F0F1-type ATP synthase alpha subunit
MSYDIVEQLKKEIAGFKHSPDWESAGRIIEVSDGIIRFSGLSNTEPGTPHHRD